MARDGSKDKKTSQESQKRCSALNDKMRGGVHYKGMVIEPMEYAIKNGLWWAEGEIIKYVSRWRNKGGIDDLEKAKHVLEALIDSESSR